MPTLTPALDERYTLRVLQDLVRIDSVNPRLVPGAAGERAIADYVAAELRELGMVVDQHEPEHGRVSVVGRLKGSRPGPTLMFNAHVDTVAVDEMDEPFSGELRDGRVYGRGAFDMKGGLAAMLGAARALRDAGCPHDGDLLIAAVADEEYASLGTADLIGKYHVDAAIVTEPTALDLCLAHKGFIWLDITTRGRAAHGSRFDLGIDANMHMGRVLADLDRLEQDLRSRTPHPLVGPPSLHAAMIAGGTGLSTYAASCVLRVERRTIPGERTERVIEEIEDILHRQAGRDAAFDGALTVTLVREPFEVAADAAIVRAASAAVRDVRGFEPAHIGQTPWMDSALLAAAGIETLVMGGSGAGAHASEEWADVRSVFDLARCLAGAVIGYPGERDAGKVQD
jgi:acetylornithine deacetylase